MFLNKPITEKPIFASFYDDAGNLIGKLTIPVGQVHTPDNFQGYMIPCKTAIFKQETGFFYTIKL
jgi:hypothetical protein